LRLIFVFRSQFDAALPRADVGYSKGRALPDEAALREMPLQPW
jgi:hypothetical protein